MLEAPSKAEVKMCCRWSETVWQGC